MSMWNADIPFCNKWVSFGTNRRQVVVAVSQAVPSSTVAVVVVAAAIGILPVVTFRLDAVTPARELPLGNSRGCLLLC
jgi:hypothetical protein